MLRKGSQETGAAACAEEVRKKEEEDTRAFCVGVGGREMAREVTQGAWKPRRQLPGYGKEGVGAPLPHLSVAMSCDFSGLGKFKVTRLG